MTGIYWVYVTCENQSQAQIIGEQIVKERLAACANILPGITSIYWWDNQIQHAQEVVLILKSPSHLFNRLEERIRALHSYECPCIVAAPIEAGSTSYLNWIRNEAKPS